MKILQPPEALTQMTLGQFEVGGLTNGADTLNAKESGCDSFNAFVCNEALDIVCTQVGKTSTDTFAVSTAMIGIPIYGNFSQLRVPTMAAANGFIAYKKGDL